MQRLKLQSSAAVPDRIRLQNLCRPTTNQLQTYCQDISLRINSRHIARTFPYVSTPDILPGHFLTYQLQTYCQDISLRINSRHIARTFPYVSTPDTLPGHCLTYQLQTYCQDISLRINSRHIARTFPYVCCSDSDFCSLPICQPLPITVSLCLNILTWFPCTHAYYILLGVSILSCTCSAQFPLIFPFI